MVSMQTLMMFSEGSMNPSYPSLLGGISTVIANSIPAAPIAKSSPAPAAAYRSSAELPAWGKMDKDKGFTRFN